MKKMKYLLLFFVLVLLAACSQKTLENNGLMTIELKESKDILPISSFVQKVDYIELKVNEVGLETGEILAVKEIGNDFLLKRRQSGKTSFMRFSKNGDYIVGIGGDNHPKIREAIDIIAFEKGYAVLAENGIHLVGKDGKYQKAIDRSTMQGPAFFASGNQFWVVNDADPVQLVTAYPKSGKAMRPVQEQNERLKRMLNVGVQEFGKGRVHVFSALSDTVFSFQNGLLSPAYAFSSGDLASFSEVWTEAKKLEDTKALRLIHDTIHVDVKNVLENDHYIYLSYWVGSAATNAVYTKSTGEVRYFAHGVNDIDGGIWDKALFLTARDELLIPITAYKVSGHKISNTRVKGFDGLQKRLAVTGNPVLMRCQLR